MGYANAYTNQGELLRKIKFSNHFISLQDCLRAQVAILSDSEISAFGFGPNNCWSEEDV